jgi:hypothetical protein
VRSGFRKVVRPRGDRFLVTDIPISMHVHARGCRVNAPGSVTLWRTMRCRESRIAGRFLRREHDRPEFAGDPW